LDVGFAQGDVLDVVAGGDGGDHGGGVLGRRYRQPLPGAVRTDEPGAVDLDRPLRVGEVDDEDPVGVGGGPEALQRAVVRQPAMVDHHDAAAEAFDVAEVVG